MTNIQIAPLPTRFLLRVRNEGLDDQNQPVHRLVASGGEPCRDVLRRARPGEELILASYCPFSLEGPYREYGPVFVLANGEDQTSDTDSLPIGDPATAYLRDTFVLRAYGHHENIRDAKLVRSAEAAEVVEKFLADEEVAFVHARFPTYGCFALRVDRA